MLEAARPLAQTLRSLPKADAVEFLANADAEGVAASAILARALTRARRGFHVRFLVPFEPARLDPESESAVRLWIGRPGLPGIPSPAPGPRSLFVADARAEPHPNPAFTLEPARAGYAPRDASLSAAALTLAVALDDANWDLAPLAVAGALIAARTSVLTGWNAHMATEAVRRGHLQERIDVSSPDEPLLDLLANPPLHWGPRAAAGYESAQQFLRDHNLPSDASPAELAPDEKERLASALCLHHLRARAPPAELARLFAPQFVLPGPPALPAARLGQLLRAAAYEGESGLALGFLLGDASARAVLDDLLHTHNERVREFQRAEPKTPPNSPLAIGETPHETYAPLFARLLSEGSGHGPRFALVKSTRDAELALALSVPPQAARGFSAGALLEEVARNAGGHGGGTPHEARAVIPQTAAGDVLGRLEEAAARTLAQVVP